MKTLTNNQYRIRVQTKDLHSHRAGETLVLTFSSRPVAMAAYRDMPSSVWASFPIRIETAVYRDSQQAVDSATDFFG